MRAAYALPPQPGKQFLGGGIDSHAHFLDALGEQFLEPGLVYKGRCDQDGDVLSCRREPMDNVNCIIQCSRVGYHGDANPLDVLARGRIQGFDDFARGVNRPRDPDERFFLTRPIAPSFPSKAAERAIRPAAISIREQEIQAMELGIAIERSTFKSECHRSSSACLDVIRAFVRSLAHCGSSFKLGSYA